MASSSTIIIEELAGSKRTIMLSGSALPLKGASWPDETIQATTWFPGNPVASQQVLSETLAPSSWNFEWHTVRLIRSPVRVSTNGGSDIIIERARTLYELFRSLKGRSLRVTWAADSGGGSVIRIVRTGLLVKIDPAFDLPDDIKVTCDFAWSSDGQTKRSPVSSIRDDGELSKRVEAVKSSDAVAKAILESRMRSRISTIPGSADRFTLGQLEQLAKAPLQLVNQFARVANSASNRVRKIGDLIQTVRATPASIVGSMADAATDAIGSANGFVDRMSREPPETWTADVKVSSMLRNASYYNGALTQAGLMARIYAQLALQSKRRQSGLAGTNTAVRRGDAYQLHVPKPGETFALLAQQYYGNSDLAPVIAKANGLPGYTVEVPRLPIIIPTIKATQDATRKTV